MILSQASGNFQFILDKKLSDHKPIKMDHFLIWNMLCLAKVNNNGFRIDETHDNGKAYYERLKEIAAYINQWLYLEPHIEFICLQEAPYLSQYLTFFLDALDWKSSLKCFDRKNICVSRTGFHKFQNLTFYSSQYTAENITKKLSLSFNCQENRYHILELTHQQTGLIQRIGNVHLAWFSEKKLDARLATQVIIKELILKHKCSLAGDFNQSLEWMFEDPQLIDNIKAFYYPQKNNIVFLKEGALEETSFHQIDALILRKH